jgi:hypothetical protein
MCTKARRPIIRGPNLYHRQYVSIPQNIESLLMQSTEVKAMPLGGLLMNRKFVTTKSNLKAENVSGAYMFTVES